MGANKMTVINALWSFRKKTFNVLQIDVANVNYHDDLNPIRGPLNLE